MNVFVSVFVYMFMSMFDFADLSVCGCASACRTVCFCVLYAYDSPCLSVCVRV